MRSPLKMAISGEAGARAGTHTRRMTRSDVLATRLDGSLHLPGDPEYVDSCTLFNAAIARRPAMVIRCVTSADVAVAIRHARDHDLPLAVRGGGHSVSGACLCDDGVVLDMRALDDVSVDPAARTATVGGGCLSGALDRATQVHGLATTIGRVSTTGVAGFALGGGSGWLERQHGFACDNLLAADVVTADGELVTADADTHSDLFWALRGGGGNFGAVTSLTFRLHPVGPTVTSGLLLYPGDRSGEILRHVRDFMTTAPEHVAAGILLLYGFEDDAVPAELQGQLMVAVWAWHLGSVERAEKELAELRGFGPPAADTITQGAYADLQCAMDDPPGFRNYFTAEHVDQLTDAAISTVCDHAGRLPQGPGWTFLVPWGGAVSRLGGGTPLTNRSASWIVHPGAFWTDATGDDEATAWARSFRHELQPFASGGVWLNWTGEEGEDRVRAAFGAPNYDRLRAVKAAYDPANLFRSNHNVPPLARDRSTR
jgi:FAD/FMN-containing dehydrogenase